MAIQTHAFVETERDRVDRDVVLAWNVAVLSRQKRIPHLKTLLRRCGTSGRTSASTPEAQKQLARMLTVAFGGTIRERSHEHA